MSDLHTRLRSDRVAKGLTQEDVASLGGVSVQSQRNYESGKRAPDSTYLSKISKKLDVAYIVTGEMTNAEQAVLNEVDKRVVKPYDPEVGKRARELTAELETIINTDRMKGDFKEKMTPWIYSCLMTGQFGTTIGDLTLLFIRNGWPLRDEFMPKKKDD